MKKVIDTIKYLTDRFENETQEEYCNGEGKWVPLENSEWTSEPISKQLKRNGLDDHVYFIARFTDGHQCIFRNKKIVKTSNKINYHHESGVYGNPCIALRDIKNVLQGQEKIDTFESGFRAALRVISEELGL